MLSKQVWRPALAAFALGLALASCTATTAGSAAPVATVTVLRTVTEVATVPADPPTLQSAETSSSDVAASGITPRDKAPDPCKLLTQKEADTLAGMALQKPVGAGAEQGVNTLCDWTRDPNASGTGQVSIIVGDGSKKALDIDKDTLAHPFKKVAGIGDECWQEDGGIWIRKGTVWANINLVLLDDPSADVTPMQQAAKLVAGRM